MAVVADHHVLRLDVAVTHALRVQQGQRATHLREERRCLPLRQHALVTHEIEEVGAAHKLHHDVKVLVVLIERLQARNIRVHAHTLQSSHLASNRLGVGAGLWQDFDRDFLPRPLAAALPHGSKRTGAELIAELVILTHLGLTNHRCCWLAAGDRAYCCGGCCCCCCCTRNHSGQQRSTGRLKRGQSKAPRGKARDASSWRPL